MKLQTKFFIFIVLSWGRSALYLGVRHQRYDEQTFISYCKNCIIWTLKLIVKLIPMSYNSYCLGLILATRTQKWILQKNSWIKLHIPDIFSMSLCSYLVFNKYVILFLHFIYLKLCLTLFMCILMYRARKNICNAHIYKIAGLTVVFLASIISTKSRVKWRKMYKVRGHYSEFW